MISLWILSIFLSVFGISLIYYIAYKKDGTVGSDSMMGLIVLVSLGAGFMWLMAICICNMDFDLGDSVDEMVLSVFGPMIGVAIIHFIILLPAYFVYKGHSTK